MEIINGIENYTKKNKPLYLALGNFDGVHKGHQRLIRTCVDQAKKANGVSAALIYDPHPLCIVAPERAPKLLVTKSLKAELFEKIGLDILIFTPFTSDISKCTPEQFVNNILIERLGVTQVFVGFNHSFGYKGAGTPDLLKNMGMKKGFTVNIISSVKIDEDIVSSTMVRQMLVQGNIGKASDLLGYYPVVEGTVVQGAKRGSSIIGYPTANLLSPAEYAIPARGVYAARALVNGKIYKAVVNIGIVPTFNKDSQITIEAHLIDFDQNIYGKDMRLYFVERIRDERKFDSVEQLVEQITKDKEKGIQLLDKLQ